MQRVPTRWERWTIDEVGEGIARVLVSVAREPIQAMRLTDESLAGTTSRDRSRALRAAAMDIELSAPGDRWTEEVDVYLPLGELAALVQRRRRKPGLPGERPLREGDVFWVVTYNPVETGELPAVPSSDSRDLAARYLEAGADVLDVTAAARQAAKTWYRKAVRRAGPREPDG